MVSILSPASACENELTANVIAKLSAVRVDKVRQNRCSHEDDKIFLSNRIGKEYFGNVGSINTTGNDRINMKEPDNFTIVG